MKRKLASVLIAIAVFLSVWLATSYTIYSFSNKTPADNRQQKEEATMDTNSPDTTPETFEPDNAVIDGENTDEIGNNGTKEYNPQSWIDGIEQPADGQEKETSKWEEMSGSDVEDTEEEEENGEEEERIKVETKYDSGLKIDSIENR